jgi:hypothetical protein
MTNRKASTTGVTSDPATAQDNMNQLYAAHQVHALAQIVFRQFAGWQGQTPWTQQPFGAPAGAGFGSPVAMQGGPMTLPPAPPALFYWYP